MATFAVGYLEFHDHCNTQKFISMLRDRASEYYAVLETPKITREVFMDYITAHFDVMCLYTIQRQYELACNFYERTTSK